MAVISPLPTRHPIVPRLALDEQSRENQIRKGLYIVDRGEKFALPVDSLKNPRAFQGKDVWRQSPNGIVYRAGAKPLPPRFTFQQKALTWLRDHVNENIPYWYYLATIGHDLHVSTWGDLYGKHFHAGWASPFGDIREPFDPSFETFFATHFTPDHISDVCRLGKRCPKALNTESGWRTQFASLRGFREHLGWLSGAKVSDAFVSEEIDELVSTTGTEYADFDFHEVGTSNQAESNNDTALIATSGIARATGSPTDADPIYRNVGTVTADASETWQEHGLFNNSSGAALMDRSLTGGQAVVSSDQVQYTYELTKNPEA